MRDDLLTIYLNDHLAGATLGVELVKRCLGENAGSALGAFLRELLEEVEEDRAVLEGLLRRLGRRADPVKKAGAWLAEKVGRAKLNGSLFAYSDLSRVEELEMLLLGVRGKRALWVTLRALPEADSRFGVVDFEALERRAERQLEQIERYRLEAVRRAFVAPG